MDKNKSPKLQNHGESEASKIRIDILDNNEKLSYIMERIRDAGFAVYAVGGCVRDALLGIVPGDFDIASSASWEIISELFPTTKKLGEQFGTFGTVRIVHEGFSADAATFRIETGYSDFRRPDKIHFTGDISKDLERRDFTINAMAYNRWEGLIDIFGGLEDLKNRKIRAVMDPEAKFSQDALRILRAVRFSGQLDFEIEEETLKAMKKYSYLASTIKKERVRQEIQKAIVSKAAGRVLKEYLYIGLFDYIGHIVKDKSDGITPDEILHLSKGEISTLTQPEISAIEEVSNIIDDAKCNFDTRISLILAQMEKERSENLARYLGLKKSRINVQY